LLVDHRSRCKQALKPLPLPGKTFEKSDGFFEPVQHLLDVPRSFSLTRKFGSIPADNSLLGVEYLAYALALQRFQQVRRDAAMRHNHYLGHRRYCHRQLLNLSSIC